MPQKTTTRRAKTALRQGKRPTTAAGEFVREEIHHVREGRHGARSPKQVIAIGLSKARREGIEVPAPKKGRTSERTRRSAERDLETGRGERKPRAPSTRRSSAVKGALKREPRSTTSSKALSRQASGTTRKTTSRKKPTTARKTTSTARKTTARKSPTTRSRASARSTAR